MRKPKIPARNRLVWPSAASVAAILKRHPYLTAEVERELRHTEDRGELRGEKQDDHDGVPGDLPHRGSVDG